jgi:hypothetical protein
MHLKFHTSLSVSNLQPDQVVDFDTKFDTKVIDQNIKLAVSEELGIAPKDIFLHLLKVVGEQVRKNELLAEKKTFLGSKSVHSEFDGIIKEINHEDGSIMIEIHTQVNQEESAYFTGKIVEIEGNTLTLDVKNMRSYQLKTANRDFGGPVFATDEVSLPTLHEEIVKGNVIFIDSIKPSDVVRLDVLEEAGLVTLHEASPSRGTNYALIQNPADWQHILAEPLRYCIVDRKNNTIHFYE